MINCSQTREILDQYIRGLLSSEKSNSVIQHLNSCSECFDESESLAALMSVLERETTPAIGADELADFMPGIWSKIEPATPEKRWLGRLAPILASVAVLSVLVFRPSLNYLTVAEQSSQSEQIATVNESAQYNQSTYQGLLQSLFVDNNSEDLDKIENELDGNTGILVNGSFETELNYLSDEGLKAVDKKLGELRRNEG
jgi:hypothetical protein